MRVCVRACVRACVRVCVCVHCPQWSFLLESIIIFLQADSDFYFLDKDSTYLYSKTLDNFRDYVNGLSIEGVWHHAMLISG